MCLKEAVGAVLRRTRIDKQLSLSSVAEQVGIKKGSLSLIETGNRGCTMDTLAKICEALGVKVSTVIRKSEDMCKKIEMVENKFLLIDKNKKHSTEKKLLAKARVVVEAYEIELCDGVLTVDDAANFVSNFRLL